MAESATCPPSTRQKPCRSLRRAFCRRNKNLAKGTAHSTAEAKTYSRAFQSVTRLLTGK
jgi:hypothetical protein